MSKKVKRTIQNKKFRIASICTASVLAVILIVGIAFNIFAAPAQVPYFGAIDPDTGRGEYEDEYVFGKKVYTPEDKFLWLEIVPDAGYGELGYMVGNDDGGVALSDIQKIKDKNTRSNLLSMYKQQVYSFIDGSGGGGWSHIDDDGHIVDCEYVAEDGNTYYDRNYLARGLAGSSYLSNKFEIITISPEDLNKNPELVDRADLIYISKGPHGSPALYNAMAAAAQASGDAELMAKYPVRYSQVQYSATNNLSKEVAWKIIQHNIVNDKALIFDFASTNGSPQDYDYISKVYELVAGINSDALRSQFIKEPVTDASGKVVRYEGDIGYFDVENFQLHLVGPEINLGYNVPITLDKDNQWVLKRDWAGWMNGTYLQLPAGTLISQHWEIKDQPLRWDSYMFSAINTGLLGKQAFDYPYYNANAIPEGYMNGSVYVFNGNCHLTQNIYGPVGGITDNNFPQMDVDYDQAKEIYGDDITNNEIIKYILGIYPTRTEEINVLEVQPAGFYQYSRYDKSSFTRTVTDFDTAIELMYYLGADTSVLTRKNYAQRVKITSVPANCFNAMNDVLTTEYDLIIMGTQTEAVDLNVVRTQGFKMNLDRKDDRLDGLVYTSVGDIFGLSLNGKYPSGDYYAGYEASGPGYTRMGGNDLTDKAYEKIIVYADRVGMPLMLADDIYEGNRATIGSTTNVYKLGQLVEKDNVVQASLAGLSHNFGLKNAYRKVVEKKAKIAVEYPLPLEYDGDIVKNTGMATKNMEFSGIINGAAGCSYRYTIYVDRNGDGIYRTDNVVDDKNEIFGSGTMTFDEKGNLSVNKDSGEDISLGESEGASQGNHFSIKVTLPDALVGYFRWRMVVVEEESLVESDYQGAFMVASEPKSVKVLQIIPDVRNSRYLEMGKPVANRPLSGGFRNSKNVQPLRLLLSSAYARSNYEDLTATAERFETLFARAREVTGLSLEVTTLTTAGYENLFVYNDAGNVDIDAKSYRGPSDYEDYNRNPLLQYDMVVLGFSDNYSSDAIGNNQGAVNLLKDYSARGNAILFAHDTMMYTNYSDGYMTAAYEEINYGHNTNRSFNSMVNVLRDVSGADRYNVSTALNSDGTKNTESEYWKRTLPALESDGKTYNYGELGQLQGFSSMFLMRYGNGAMGSVTTTTTIYASAIESLTAITYNSLKVSNNQKELKAGETYKVRTDTGTSIQADSGKQWSDGYAGTKYVKFGKVFSGSGSKARNCINFTKTAQRQATVKVWWRAGENGGQVIIYNEDGREIARTSENSRTNGLYLSELAVDTTTMISIASTNANAYIYKVEVVDTVVNQEKVDTNRKYGTLFIGDNTFNETGATLTYTQKSTKINEGQVTQYPYLIGEVLDTALTHSQWYQLDLEKKDDQSQEVVVWYALSDGTGSDNACKEQIAQFYEANGLDAVNDYYIYSKGNITYSGAGHSSISGDAEQKLFINTIIRAITSGNSVPKASFVNAVLTDAARRSYTQYIRDENNAMVTFMGTDDDLRMPEHETDYNAGQFKEAFLYWDVDDNQIYNEGVDVKLKTYTMNSTNANPENTLYNMIPRSISLNDYTAAQYRNRNGQTMMDMLATNDVRIGAYVTDSYGAIGTASVKLVLREIFNLN